MTYKKMLLLVLATLILLTIQFLSCKLQQAEKSSITSPGLENPGKEQQQTDWRAEWEQIVIQGKKEGRVVIFNTLSSEARKTLSEVFKNKYGIQLEFVTGSGIEFISKVKKERTAGIFSTDLWTGGINSLFLYLRPEGGIDPIRPLLILPEVLDPNVWWQGKLPFVDKDGRDVIYFQAGSDSPIAINTTMVRKDEIKSYYDLLQPKWGGKIVLKDPSFPGSGLQWFRVVGEEILNLDFMRQLAEQKPMIIRDSRLMADWLAKGKYPLAIATGSDIFVDYIEAGAPIAELTPKEGTYVSAGKGHIALLNRAPHPRAAQVFINWTLSREGQLLNSRIGTRQSARLDVPTDHLRVEHVRKPDVKYFITMTEDHTLKDDYYLDLARQIFSPLLK